MVVRFGEGDEWPDRPDMTLPPVQENPSILESVGFESSSPDPAADPAPDPDDEDEPHVEVPGMDVSDFETKADIREVDLLDQTRLDSAFALKLSGATWPDIARVLDFRSPAAARLAVEKVLARTLRDDDNDAKSVRKWSNLRLEALMKSMAGNALSPTIEIVDPKNPEKKIRVPNELHIPYAREMLKLVDRHARLNGADAPQVLQFVTPGVEEFEKTVALMITAANSDAPIEADIFADDQPEMELVDGVWQLIEKVDPEAERDAS